MKQDMSRRPTCAFVGDQSLVVRCVDIARDAGLAVSLVASHNADVLQAVAGERTEVVELVRPADLATAVGGKHFDALFCVAYEHVVSDAVLQQATVAINFHDGPLPDYAGLQVTSWAIANGESRHGVTWHYMTSQIDGGDIVAEARFEIEPIDTALSLNARCFEVGAEVFADVARAVASNSLPRIPQAERPGLMYRRRQRPTVVVDPQVSAAELARSIRALQVGDRVLNTVGSPLLILGDQAYVVADAAAEPGTTGAGPVGSVEIGPGGRARIVTTDGILVLGDIRLPDGRAAHLPAGQITPQNELATALRELDPVLHDHEGWWRDELTAPVATASLDTLDAAGAIDKASTSFVSDAEPATVAAALLLLLASRADGDTVALEVTDASTAELMERLAPLVCPPQFRASATPERTVSSLRDSVEQAMTAALEHGPYLADLTGRDPSLRGAAVPPVAHLHLGTSTVSSAPASDHTALAVSLVSGRITMAGRGQQIAIDDLANQLAHIIDVLQASPSAVLASLDLTTAADREILASLNDTAIARLPQTIDQQFRASASTLGDRPALSCAGVTLSYSELVERVDALAARLHTAGVRNGDIVGIALDRSLDLVSSVLAVLSVGATYLPLDLDYPTDRLQFMIDDSATSVVMGGAAVSDRFAGELTVLDPAHHGGDTGSAPIEPAHSVDDLAYVIYTSGSTGTPKGVQLEHAQVDNFFTGMDVVVGGEVPGVWLAVTSLSFDISVLELLWTVTRGYHVVLKQSSGFQPVHSFNTGAPSMSFFHFAASDAQAGDGYRLLLESSKWADERGFEAVWTPERHFHDFGAPYPNPSVVAAAVAAVTDNIHIRAGSVVLPLHSPVRVAEEWSVVDNLSNGRVGISFAAGWQQDDFVLNPSGFANARDELPDRIETVRELWRGNTVDMPGPDGEPVSVKTLPRPVQDELPVWLTSAGSPSSFERAGTLGVNLLTHLLGQTIDQLTENIATYRAARKAAGHPGNGHVTLMLHTFLGPDGDAARETARQPLIGYLGTAVGLIKSKASMFPTFSGATAADDDAFSSLDDSDIDQLLELAAERYLSTSGLFGTVDDALDMVATATGAGVDEIACLIDFGIDADVVMQSLDLLGQVHDRMRQSSDETETVASLVERHQVSHLQCTPSLASMLVADPSERAALAELDHMMVGGEALPTELAAELADLVPGRVTNMYGPTETTIWSLTHDLPESAGGIGGSIPIGTPIANTTIHILDSANRGLPTGVFGELFIGGAGVARGYLNRPELTAERFVELPGNGRVYATGDIARIRADGIVEFAGRSDGQVKIRGHRIEVGEIEAALDRIDSVGRSVVVASGQGEPTLRAFVVPSPGKTPDRDELAAHLAASLPAAMIPSAFDVLDQLPFTPNGKVDRKRLSEMSQSTAAAAHDDSVPEGTQAIVAAVWRDQLGHDVRPGDNFFDVGGHSLMAITVFRKLGETTGAPISLTDVFRYPTVELFAAHLDRLLGSGETQAAPAPESTGGTARGSRRRQALARRGRET